MLSPNNIKNLVKLFRENDDERSSSDDDLPYKHEHKLGPGDVGKRTKVKIKGNELRNPSEPINKDPSSIWDVSEVPEVPHTDDAVLDPRDKPEYEITYKQNVSTEDVFLQLGNKTPTSASCEWMLVSISLEGENREEIDCHVTNIQLDIRSPKYRLCLPLPHPVDPDSCSAEWDPPTSHLNVTLLLKREFDYVNF